MDVLSPFISVLCHSDRRYKTEITNITYGYKKVSLMKSTMIWLSMLNDSWQNSSWNTVSQIQCKHNATREVGQCVHLAVVDVAALQEALRQWCQAGIPATASHCVVGQTHLVAAGSPRDHHDVAQPADVLHLPSSFNTTSTCSVQFLATTTAGYYYSYH